LKQEHPYGLKDKKLFDDSGSPSEEFPNTPASARELGEITVWLNYTRTKTVTIKL